MVAKFGGDVEGFAGAPAPLNHYGTQHRQNAAVMRGPLSIAFNPCSTLHWLGGRWLRLVAQRCVVSGLATKPLGVSGQACEYKKRQRCCGGGLGHYRNLNVVVQRIERDADLARRNPGKFAGVKVEVRRIEGAVCSVVLRDRPGVRLSWRSSGEGSGSAVRREGDQLDRKRISGRG
jgi:hypothetical protein